MRPTRSSFLLRIGVLVVGAQALAAAAAAQVTLDGTLGRGSGSLPGPNYQIGAELGRQMGPNLFHSFGQFNVQTGESATFSGPASVTNIIGRVTGGSASNIDGTIRSTIAGASLYLINPSGIALGPNAELDVSGSFHVSTADYLRFADGARFAATDPGSSTLTVAPPVAFGFLAQSPAGITLDGALLFLPETGTTLSVIGGPVSTSGTLLQAAGGQVHVAALAGPGEVPVDPRNGEPSAGTRLGPVTLSFSTLDASGFDNDPAGTVAIRGGQVVLDGSGISTGGAGPTAGGGIVLRADETLVATNGTEITTDSSGAGRVGPIAIRGGDISLSDTSIATRSQGQARAADLQITANSLSLAAGATIASRSSDAGGAGDVVVRATGPVAIDGSGADSLTAISVQTATSTPAETGNLTLEAEQLTLTSGGVLASSSVGSRSGGNITVRTGSRIDISGAGSDRFTGIASLGTIAGDGNVGAISLETGTLSLSSGAFISASNLGGGPGGSIDVMARDRVEIDGGGQQTAILASALIGSQGRAGNVRVTTGSVSLRAGGKISSETGGQGRGGDVTVIARDAIEIANEGSQDQTAISAATLSTASGDAGLVNIQAHDLTVRDGGAISSNSVGAGRGGDVTVDVAGGLTLTGTGPGSSVSGIFAGTSAANGGNAGSIRVTAGTLAIDSGAKIASDTSNGGRGGDIQVGVADRLTIDGQGSTVASLSAIAARALSGSTGDGGSVTITAGSAELRNGGQVISNSFGRGRGGSVTFRVGGALSLSGFGPTSFPSGIFAETRAGDGGDAGTIDVSAGTLAIDSGGQIASTTFGAGRGGSVAVAVADRLTVDALGVDPSSLTGISAAAGRNSSGAAGTVAVSAGTIELGPGGRILSTASGAGPGGNVAVAARDRLSIAGSAAAISAGADSFGAGIPGSVSVEAGSITIADGGRISTAGFGTGGTARVVARDSIAISGFLTGITADGQAGGTPLGGGTITVETGSLSLSDGGIITSQTSGGARGSAIQVSARGGVSVTGVNSRIGADTLGIATLGNAGSVSIDAQALDITDGGLVTSGTFGLGNGGGIRVTAETVRIDGGGFLTGILTEATTISRGDAGAIDLTARTLTLRDSGAIASNSFGQGRGGDVRVTIAGRAEFAGDFTGLAAVSTSLQPAGQVSLSAGSLTLKDGASISTQSAVAEGGNITVLASDLLYLKDSGIRTSVFAGRGGGGDISIGRPRFVVLNRGAIIADAVGGNGGNILISSDQFLATPDSLVSASSRLGIDGTITIEAPNIDVSAAVVALPGGFLDASALVRDSCTAAAERPRSSLAPTGRGGLAQEADGAQPAYYLADRVPEPGPAVAGASVVAAAPLPRLSVTCGRF